MNVKKYTVIVILLLFITLPIKAESWNDITPLKSNRSDVEKTIGKPNKSGFYLIGDDKIRIFYSSGKSKINHCDGKCPDNLVTQISVDIGFDLKINALNLDMKKFSKVIDTNLPSRSTYSNLDDGIIYSVSEEDNEVLTITYLPKKEDCADICGKNCKI